MPAHILLTLAVWDGPSFIYFLSLLSLPLPLPQKGLSYGGTYPQRISFLPFIG